jgi:biotin carboxyl carrier protein
MYKALVNGHTYEVITEEKIQVNGKPVDWNAVTLEAGHFHILHKNVSYRAEVIHVEPSGKMVDIKINGRVYKVQVKDKVDLLLEKMGMNVSSGSKINRIKAPMPGLVIDLKVKAGDVVRPGDQLLILEAMKMENIIKSPMEGTIKIVPVRKGESVEKGQVLIEF